MEKWLVLQDGKVLAAYAFNMTIWIHHFHGLIKLYISVCWGNSSLLVIT